MTNKINKTFVTAIILCGIILSTLTACSLPSSEATSLTLDQQKVTIYTGDTLKLNAQTDKADAEITWSSDATHIAKVEDGIVTAIAPGEAIITARIGKLKAYCKVVVEQRFDDLFKEGLLKDVYTDYFLVGTAIQTDFLTAGKYGDILNHFNSVTAENNMKWRHTEATKGVHTFNRAEDSPDGLIAWAKENGILVRGHTLLWYKAVPLWLHEEFKGQEYSEQAREDALFYIERHIEEMMEHFGDNVYVWDVVNEVLSNSIKQSQLTPTADNPYGNIWRTSDVEGDGMEAHETDWVDWYKITGSYDYISKAFIKAGQVREENNLSVELYYNDYGLHKPNKRQACLNLIQMLRDSGAPIDGVGMQAHYKLSEYLSDKNVFLKNFEDSIKAFIAAGVDVQITELDIRYDGNFTKETEALQAEMFGEIFKICRKYAKTEGMEHGVTGVTTWGPYDGCHRVSGDIEHKFIFSAEQTPKDAYYAIVKFED